MKQLMDTDESHCHTGHRKRLRQLIDRVGLKNLTDIQIIEQLLTVTNARKDTNVTAHKLLKKFGSISRILDATYSELIEIDGIGEITAKLITYIPQLFEIYNQEKLSNANKIGNYGDIHRIIYPYFKKETKECIYLAYIDKNDKMTCCEKISEGDFSTVKIDISNLICKLIKRTERKFIFAHNHPHGSLFPSKQDYDTFCLLNNTLGQLKFEVVDCIIIDSEKYYSMKNSMIIETKKNKIKI